MDHFNKTHTPRFKSLSIAKCALYSKINGRDDLKSGERDRLKWIIDKLCSFPLGQHILLSGGSNGFWTDYMISSALENPAIDSSVIPNELEEFILHRSPVVLAQRELFYFSKNIAQEFIEEGNALASVPCGLMRDLLSLNFDNMKQISLTGIDIDPHSIDEAKILARDCLASSINFLHKDAWSLSYSNKFNFINSIGLNVYESDRDKVIEFYRRMCSALTFGGVFVTGVLTYPPWSDEPSDWELEKISSADVDLERMITQEVLEVGWANYRKISEIQDDFIKAGFSRIEVHKDEFSVFPAVMAFK